MEGEISNLESEELYKVIWDYYNGHPLPIIGEEVAYRDNEFVEKLFDYLRKITSEEARRIIAQMILQVEFYKKLSLYPYIEKPLASIPEKKQIVRPLGLLLPTSKIKPMYETLSNAGKIYTSVNIFKSKFIGEISASERIQWLDTQTELAFLISFFILKRIIPHNRNYWKIASCHFWDKLGNPVKSDNLKSANSRSISPEAQTFYENLVKQLTDPRL